jgi:hypothetical protein
MLWPLAESALAAGSAATSGPAQTAKLKSAKTRFMPFFSPGVFAQKADILAKLVALTCHFSAVLSFSEA